MINHNEAMKKVAAVYPDRTPSAIFDYDADRYIVSAPRKSVSVDYNGAFFSVNKSNAKVEVFFPGEDYDKFFDAIDNKQLR